MKIAVISDIHDNVWKLEAALGKIRELKPEALFCCGDLCSPFIVGMMSRALHGVSAVSLVPIHVVFGNNDADLFRMTLQAVPGQMMFYGELAEFVVADGKLRPRREFVDPKTKVDHYFDAAHDGRRIAVQHFDYLARPLAVSGKYAAVFYGHNHKRRHERADTMDVINPGAIMGYDGLNQVSIASTFVLYDTAGKESRWYEIVASSVEDGSVNHSVNEYHRVPLEKFQLEPPLTPVVRKREANHCQQIDEILQGNKEIQADAPASEILPCLRPCHPPRHGAVAGALVKCTQATVREKRTKHGCPIQD